MFDTCQAKRCAKWNGSTKQCVCADMWCERFKIRVSFYEFGCLFDRWEKEKKCCTEIRKKQLGICSFKREMYKEKYKKNIK